MTYMKLNNLLTYLMKEQVEESIRSLPGKSFNMREFKAIKSSKEISAYVHETLEPISNNEFEEGSSRKVFILSSGKVLKLAKIDYDEYSGHYDDDTDEWVSDEDPQSSNDKGAAQNEAEFNIYRHASAEIKQILPRVYDYDKDFYWLISELVKPLKSEEWAVFEKLSGVSKEELIEFSIDMNTGSERENYEDNPFLLTLFDLSEFHDLCVGDMIAPHQWGTTTEGRLVLLDTGGTNNVLDRFYETE